MTEGVRERERVRAREKERRSGRTVQLASPRFSHSIHSGAKRTRHIGEGRGSKKKIHTRGKISRTISHRQRQPLTPLSALEEVAESFHPGGKTIRVQLGMSG